MKNNLFYATLCAALLGLSLSACGGSTSENKEEAAGPVQSIRPDGPIESNPASTRDFSTKIGGQHYVITIKRQADKALPTIKSDGDIEFYDNRVDVCITRDGRDFFAHSYTKEAFLDFISSDEAKGYVLLGMAWDEAETEAKGKIVLMGQVGVPGVEEGPSFSIEIASDGSTSSIVKKQYQETGAIEPDSEDQGV
ncbi:MAG: DUF4738 domain-containing protein [Alloprevotella sp.]